MAQHATHLEHGHEQHDDAGHHILPASKYYTIFGVLMVFLFLTVAAAYVDLTAITRIPGLNIVVMLLIAIIKATCVVMVFMHVKYGTKLTWLWAATGFVWFVIMFGLLMDYFTRNWGAAGWQQETVRSMIPLLLR
jgi:cytochrome c oxidase subunit IV